MLGDRVRLVTPGATWTKTVVNGLATARYGLIPCQHGATTCPDLLEAWLSIDSRNLQGVALNTYNDGIPAPPASKCRAKGRIEGISISTFAWRIEFEAIVVQHGRVCTPQMALDHLTFNSCVWL